MKKEPSYKQRAAKQERRRAIREGNAEIEASLEEKRKFTFKAMLHAEDIATRKEERLQESQDRDAQIRAWVLANPEKASEDARARYLPAHQSNDQ